MAIDSPRELIDIQDSLVNSNLSKKNQEALALAHRKIGMMHMVEKNYLKAKNNFSNVLVFLADDSTARYNLLMIDGHLLRKTGKKENLWNAIEIYYKASRFQPDNGEPFFFIGKSYQSLNGNDFDLILESYQKAIELKLPEMIKNDVEQEILSVSKREKKLKDFWK